MKRFTTYFAKLTTPLHQTPEDGIRYWQEKILSNLLLVSLIFGFITWIPSVALSVKEELWAVAVLDTLILAFVAVLVFRRDLPYQFRASAFPVPGCLFRNQPGR